MLWGVDMGGACGQPIWAAQDGVVVDRSSGGQSGNNIRLDHGKVKGVKLETAYLHMQSMSVKVGEKVKRGQQIGTVKVTLDGNVVAEAPLVAVAAVEESGFFKRLWDAFWMWWES